MSTLTRNTFREDGYRDGRSGRGKRPSPPDKYKGSDVFKREYMDGWEQGNHEYCCEQAFGWHGQD